MFGFADRGNINNANPVWVMFWYNCIDTFVNGKRTKTNKRLLMRLKRWKITQTGTLTGLNIQGELWDVTAKRATKWNDPQALLIQYLLRNQWTSRGGQILQNLDALRAIFVWPWKMVSVSVCYFFLSTNGWKTSKHGLFVFPPNKILIWTRHCLLGKSCCSMTSKRSIGLISRKFSSMKFLHPSVQLTNQKPSAFVSAW